jgi:hypothetical protein
MRAGQGMRMRRFHSGRLREITAPRFDVASDHETVSLISDLNDETGKSIGRLEVVLVPLLCLKPWPFIKEVKI